MKCSVKAHVYISIQMLVDFKIKNIPYLEETTWKIKTEPGKVIAMNSYNNNVINIRPNVNHIHKSCS